MRPRSSPEFLGEQLKLLTASRALSPHKADASGRVVRQKRPRDETGAAKNPALDGKFGKQRYPHPVIDHLDERRKARPLELLVAAAVELTGGKGVLAQTVTILQQEKRLGGETLRLDADLIGERMKRRKPDMEGILEQIDSIHRPAIIGQRQQHDVELALMQGIDEPRGEILHEIKLQADIGAPQFGEHLWK